MEKTGELEELKIDWGIIIKKLWRNKKIIIKSGFCAIIVGIVIGFSIPKEYEASVTLSPEINGVKSVGGGLSALAGMAGINLGSSQTADAIYPELYPNIVKSINFSAELLNIEINDINDSYKTSLYKYLKEYLEHPWWTNIINVPSKVKGILINKINNENKKSSDENNINPFRLTSEQNSIMVILNKRITVEVDKKTSIIYITTKMQDPLIAATVTNQVMAKLQDYITDYRTNKARKDLEFTEKLYEENMKTYYNAQQIYAAYMDRNKNISLRSAQTQEERLRNEVELAFNIYNQTAQNLQIAKAKVQQDTPVFTIIEASTVPLVPCSPSKTKIMIGCLFLAVIGSSLWIIYGKNMLHTLKNISN